VRTPVISPPSVLQRLDVDAEAELDAEPLGQGGQGVGELEAVAGLVVGQPQAADKVVGGIGQARLGGHAAGAVEHLERHAPGLQHLDVLADPVELLLLAKQLQRALHALVVADARVGPQRNELIAAVLGQAHHAGSC
jgi:hypothetical protein